MGRLQGQVAIVTGGGRGIGREICVAFAEQGARVAVVSRTAEQIAETIGRIVAAGGAAVGISADVTNYGAVESLVIRIERELGPVDTLVNNAGSGSVMAPVAQADPQAWWREVTTNLLGPFHACRAVLQGMLVRGRGRIINMAGAGVGTPLPHGSAYGSSKAALMRLTESLDSEVAGAGVRVFAMTPGLVRTAMTTALYESGAYKRWAPRFHDMLEQGKDVPPTLSAGLAVEIASGRLDELHGRLITVRDDLEQLLTHKERIVAEDLKTLRIRELE